MERSGYGGNGRVARRQEKSAPGLIPHLLLSLPMPGPAFFATDQIQSRIIVLRGQRVLLDAELARIYGVSTSRFNEAIKRNKDRFPGDFRIQLNHEELKDLISQFAISSANRGGTRKMPWAFTEHGALMAATVLNSPRAVQMSLVVIRAFVAFRRVVLDQKALSEKLAELDAQVGIHDQQLAEIIEAIRQLAASPEPDHGRKIGFHSQDPREI
jgi:hypothetical protein